MGLLGHCAGECSSYDPNHLLPSPQTSDRIIQIKTQESRLSRKHSNADIDDIHSRSHIERRVNVPLVVARYHRPPRSRRCHPRHILFRGMEICCSSDYSSPSPFTTISCCHQCDNIPRWMLLLCKCLLSADIFSNIARTANWSAFEFGNVTISSPPSNRNFFGGRFSCSKVSLL